MQINLFTKCKQTHRHKKKKKTKTMFTKVERCKGAAQDKSEICEKHRHTTIYRTDKQKDLLYSPGNYTQHFVITYMRKES